MRLGWARAALAVGVSVVACGGRTALSERPPTWEPDVVLPVEPAQSICFTRELSLLRSEVLFVIDHSQSMNWTLGDDVSGPSRWRLLHDAIDAVLPRYGGSMSMGAVFFPDTTSARSACVAPSVPVVIPSMGGPAEVVRAMEEIVPDGLTPTAATLRGVRRYFALHPASGPRAVVLMTDGAPNCEPSTATDRCVCTSTSAAGLCDPELCLDERGAVSAIADLAADGVPTWVIGIGATDPAYRAALDRMATAGGRSTPTGPHRYQDASRADDLANTLDRVQRSVERCTLRGDADGADPSTHELVMDGASVVEGWSWRDQRAGVIALSGAACAAAEAGDHRFALRPRSCSTK